MNVKTPNPAPATRNAPAIWRVRETHARNAMRNATADNARRRVRETHAHNAMRNATASAALSAMLRTGRCHYHLTHATTGKKTKEPVTPKQGWGPREKV